LALSDDPWAPEVMDGPAILATAIGSAFDAAELPLVDPQTLEPRGWPPRVYPRLGWQAAKSDEQRWSPAPSAWIIDQKAPYLVRRAKRIGADIMASNAATDERRSLGVIRCIYGRSEIGK
jgi:hypothetical protein